MCPLHVTPMPSDSHVSHHGLLRTSNKPSTISHPHTLGIKTFTVSWINGWIFFSNPIPSVYGIFTYIKHQPDVGKYTIHGWYGKCHHDIPTFFVAAMRHSSSPSSKSLVAMKIMASPRRGEWKGVEYLRFEAGLQTHDFLLM